MKMESQTKPESVPLLQHSYISTKEEWIAFCKTLQIRSVDEYYEKVKEYPQLPENPVAVYPQFTNIVNELGLYPIRQRR
jgi:hypothetical protein